MSVYAISGTSKGIGFGFVQKYSEDPNNLVIGLVRNKAAVEKTVAERLPGRSNIHIVTADLDSYDSLKQAAAETAKIVGDRGIDVFIANGAYLPHFDAFEPIGAFGEDRHKELEKVSRALFETNIIGNIHLLSLFTPLVLKGKQKKVVHITSGHADIDFINQTDIDSNALYSAAKAATNVIVAKFSAQYKKDHVLFFSISPGFVDVGHFDNPTEEQLAALGEFISKIRVHQPYFKGPATVEQSIKDITATIDRASLESGYGGAVVSHFGNKTWV